MSAQKRPVVLIIRDGWGVSPNPNLVQKEGNATLMAKTPVQESLLKNSPFGFLIPSGEQVGLPPGQMGNSEVGHLNLGAGRIVYQDLTRISLAIRERTFFQTPAFTKLLSSTKEAGGRLHLMGLCSDGGVHSHIEHLFALLELAQLHGLNRVFVHCFTDGRDTSPTSGVDYISQLENKIKTLGVGKIASIIGRYFAMDRDNRWERVEQAYKALVNGEGLYQKDAVSAMRHWYEQGKTDEFIPPTLIAEDKNQSADQTIKDNDAVIFFNFRSDRGRQLTRALTDPTFKGFVRNPWPKVHFVCMTEYDETFHLPVAFPPQQLTNTLGEVLAQHHLKQLRVAETEKYPHVTFFFNGGKEEPAPGEDHCLVPSPKVATYDLQPEMSAYEVTKQVTERIKSGLYDVVILNFANADMVGHTGSIPAAIRAVEVTDECVGKVLAAIKEVGGAALVTADHGNAEQMLDANGQPFTAHTTNLVHIFYVAADSAKWKVRDGILADVAPTILDLLGVKIPAEMTGKSLLQPV